MCLSGCFTACLRVRVPRGHWAWGGGGRFASSARHRHNYRYTRESRPSRSSPHRTRAASTGLRVPLASHDPATKVEATAHGTGRTVMEHSSNPPTSTSRTRASQTLAPWPAPSLARGAPMQAQCAPLSRLSASCGHLLSIRSAHVRCPRVASRGGTTPPKHSVGLYDVALLPFPCFD